MLTIKYETTFKRDFKRIVKRGYSIPLMEKQTRSRCLQNIKTILYRVLIRIAGNAISHRIGY